MKMDPAKRAQTQNAGEVSSLQWFFSQSFEMMTDKEMHFVMIGGSHTKKTAPNLRAMGVKVTDLSIPGQGGSPTQ